MFNGYKKVTIIGLGYIGLPTAAMLASRGIEVFGMDVNPNVVETINKGGIHIVEPDLDILVRGAVNAGRLRAGLQPEPAEVFIIAVPTPLLEDKSPGLQYVFEAVESIAPVLDKGNVIVLESTSPVGTTEAMRDKLAELRPDLAFPQSGVAGCDVNIAHCPERVMPGRILREIVDNDRIVGGITKSCAEAALALYKQFVNGNIYLTDSRTAEMCKLTENAFRAVNIAFANELSSICDALQMNVWELITLANRHPRVNILEPGPGVGGHCIAVDPWFIVSSCPEYATLIRTAKQINEAKPYAVFKQVKEKADRFKRPIIAAMGLSFKADIDDLRGSPAIQIVKMMAESDIGEILAVDPFQEQLPTELHGFTSVTFSTFADALYKADIVVLLVDHSAFKEIETESLKQKVVIDTRGVWRRLKSLNG